jgi:hypothetical protein
MVPVVTEERPATPDTGRRRQLGGRTTSSANTRKPIDEWLAIVRDSLGLDSATLNPPAALSP